jgi:hypothetical protein
MPWGQGPTFMEWNDEILVLIGNVTMQSQYVSNRHQCNSNDIKHRSLSLHCQVYFSLHATFVCDLF